MSVKTLCGGLLGLALLGLVAAPGCRDDEKEEVLFPRWLLSVEVVESTDPPAQPVNGCPRMVWRYSTDAGEGNVEGCTDNSNTVRVYRHIDSTVTVIYRIECDGYFDSQARVYTFRPEDAIQRPGREGPEVVFYDRVALLREQ